MVAGSRGGIRDLVEDDTGQCKAPVLDVACGEKGGVETAEALSHNNHHRKPEGLSEIGDAP